MSIGLQKFLFSSLAVGVLFIIFYFGGTPVVSYVQKTTGTIISAKDFQIIFVLFCALVCRYIFLLVDAKQKTGNHHNQRG